MRGQVRLAQGDKSVVVDAYDVFVSIDLGRDVAYIAYRVSEGLRWAEITLSGAGFLLAIGAPTQVDLRA